MVAVERLSLVVSHEQRALEHLQNGVVMDVRVGEVDEHARLRIAVGVDVEVVAASGDTSADILAVVLEVHRIEADIAVLAADLADSLDHVFTLLNGGHQLRRCVVADRHQVEVEAEACTLLLQKVEEVIARNRLDVRAGVADGGTEDNAVLLQKIHRLHDGSVVALAAARIIGIRRSFDGEHEGDVAELSDSLAHCIGDQRGVGIQTEEAVIVLLGEPEDIVHADGRLAAGHHVQIYAELLALGDDLVHILEGKVCLVAVGAGPAADAVHVAGHGGIEEDQPRDVAAVLLTVCTDGLGAAKECLIAEVQEQHLRIVRIGLVDDAVDVLEPAVVGILDGSADSVELLSACSLSIELPCKINNLKIGLGAVVRVLDGFKKSVDQNGHRLTLCRMGQILNFSCHNFLLNFVSVRYLPFPAASQPREPPVKPAA